MIPRFIKNNNFTEGLKIIITKDKSEIMFVCILE